MPWTQTSPTTAPAGQAPDAAELQRRAAQHQREALEAETMEEAKTEAARVAKEAAEAAGGGAPPMGQRSAQQVREASVGQCLLPI